MKPATLARKLLANRRRAFTLVELLVVIAILALRENAWHVERIGPLFVKKQTGALAQDWRVIRARPPSDPGPRA
jgi:prepilin-type N-terminal cleavage/methylation domain-containing protein